MIHGLLKFKDNNTKEGAIEFLRCLKKYEVVVYWSDKWQRLIMRPKVRGGIAISKGLLRKKCMEKVRENLGNEEPCGKPQGIHKLKTGKIGTM